MNEWVWSIGRMILTGETGVLGENRVPVPLSSTTNLTWAGLGSNGERPVTAAWAMVNVYMFLTVTVFRNNYFAHHNKTVMFVMKLQYIFWEGQSKVLYTRAEQTFPQRCYRLLLSVPAVLLSQRHRAKQYRRREVRRCVRHAACCQVAKAAPSLLHRWSQSKALPKLICRNCFHLVLLSTVFGVSRALREQCQHSTGAEPTETRTEIKAWLWMTRGRAWASHRLVLPVLTERPKTRLTCPAGHLGRFELSTYIAVALKLLLLAA
jgi:hypothetical protein